MVMPYKNVFHLQIFKNAFVNCLQLDSPQVGSEEDSCESDLPWRCSREKPARGGRSSYCSPRAIHRGRSQVGASGSEASETRGWATEPLSWLQAGLGAALIADTIS